MQPNAPNLGTPTPTQPAPDYSFLYEKPKRSFKLPNISSRFGRMAVVVGGLVILIILIIIIKGIVSPANFSSSDYLLVLERQQEMIHLLTSDVNSTTTSDLSPADQNFVATATLSIATSQQQIYSFLAANGDKVGSVSNIFDKSIDQQLTNSLTSNNFGPTFNSTMKTQLNYYLTNIKSAYNSTRIATGQTLLRNEYNSAKLLIKAFS